MKRSPWRITPGEQIVTTILLTLVILWTTGVGSEKPTLRTVLVAILALLLSALAVEAYARLFNYLAKKQEDKS